jgi:general secretion pathway protein K
MKRSIQNERGTVLLTTLLIMTVMAAITVALMDDIRLAVKRTINVQAYAQADWQVSGAEDFITAFLTNDFRSLPPIGQAALFQSKTPLVLPTPDGVITLKLKDASHCFNLNSVVDASGKGDQNAMNEFSELAKLLGLPQNQATVLSNILVDWQDMNQQQSPNGGAEDGTYLRKIPAYRTPDTAMRGPEEMRALHGMDEDLWQLFKPFVCTGDVGERTSVNVNSLSPERLLILATALSGEKSARDVLPAAEAALRDRPAEGYASKDQLLEVLKTSGVQALKVDRVDVVVKSVFVEVITQVGPAERVRTYRFDGVDTDTPRLTYRGWGRETFRPELKTALNAEPG